MAVATVWTRNCQKKEQLQQRSSVGRMLYTVKSSVKMLLGLHMAFRARRLILTPLYRLCPCRGPPMCLDAQGGTKAKRQPFLWLLESILVDVS